MYKYSFLHVQIDIHKYAHSKRAQEIKSKVSAAVITQRENVDGRKKAQERELLLHIFQQKGQCQHLIIKILSTESTI